MTPNMTTESDKLSCIIVGAGLGGLAAALGLTKADHKVTVLEQAPQLGEVGAGIQIPPNSSRILIEWGIRDLLEPYCMAPANIFFRSYKDGHILSQQPLNPYTTEKYGYPYWHVHRADFHRVLVEAVKREDVPILLGKRVRTVDTDNNSVVTEDGSTYSADLIIGADGLKSMTRSLFATAEAYNTGQMAYRMLIKSENLRTCPELKELFAQPNLNFWLGPKMHCVVYFLQQGEQCNVVIIGPDTLSENAMVEPASVEEMRALFEGWDPTFQKLISFVDSTSKWKLQNSKELDSWVHPTANLALLGDACHATLPCLAQGAAQAVEDAGVLAELLKTCTKENLHETLKTYESIRKPRTTVVVTESTDLGDNVFHLDDGPLQQERDRKLSQSPPQVGCPNKWADPNFQKFLFSYNAFSEARTC